jgi:hypothetical protein
MNEFSRYPSDIENFRNVNFKVEAVAETKKSNPVKKKKRSKIIANPQLEATTRDIQNLIEKRQESVRPNIALIPGSYGPARNDGPNS